MHHQRARLLQDVLLVSVNVHAVGGDGPRAEDACLLQPLYHSQAGAAQAIPHVGHVLGHVDVKAGTQRRGSLHAASQRLVGEGQRGVQAKGGG